MPNSDFGLKLNEKLFDVLFAYTSDDAMRVVEAHAGAGFQSWRQFKIRCNPSGGRTDLELSFQMMSRKTCRSIADLPAAIDRMERDLRHYDAMSGHQPPLPHPVLSGKRRQTSADEVWLRQLPAIP